MNQIKRIMLLAAILTVLTARQAFAPIQETKGQSGKEPSTTASAPSTAPGSTDQTFRDPQNPSVLAALPPSPQENPKNPESTPTPTAIPTPTDCVPTTSSPNCPSSTDLPYVLPLYNVCPSGYYCRASIVPVPGGRDATCTINESELDEAYRDCEKVAALCRSSTPPGGILFQRLCSV